MQNSVDNSADMGHNASMRLQLVKINPHNRIRILCGECGESKDEVETYANLDKVFHYICIDCASAIMTAVSKP